MTYTNFSGLIGVLILTLLCYADFRSNIIKSNRRIMYWSAFVFFIIINHFIYFALLKVIAGINFQLAGGFFHFSGNSSGDMASAQFEYRTLSPILISVLYFGTGSAKFKFKNKEFSLYERILSLFRTMFKGIHGTQEKINIHLKKMGEETEKLKLKIVELHEIADECEWDIYKDEWKIIDGESELYGKHVDLLTDIRDQLARNPMDQMTVDNIRKTIETENEKIRLGINKRIRQYIRKVLLKNLRGERSLETIAIFLGVKLKNIVEEPEPNNISRVAALSLMGGIAISITFQLLRYFSLKEDMAPTGVLPSFEVQYLSMIYLCLSMFVFLLFFSFINKTKPELRGFFNSILLGAAGGFVGHLVYKLLSDSSAIFSGETLFNINMQEFAGCMWGLLLGIISSIVCYLFYHFCAKSINRIVFRYFAIILIGGILFWAVYVALKQDMNYLNLEIFQHLKGFSLGVIVLTCVSFVSGAIENKS
jgi:uncharacterized membrane protein YeaQ/YmgE (transglycosylase-associated protein family)